MSDTSSSDLRETLGVGFGDARAAPHRHGRRELRNANEHLSHRFAHYVRRPLQRLLPVCFGLAVTSALILGWLTREEQHVSPKEGLGYWLGIIGAAMILLLLLYPLRKRIRSLNHLGSIKMWFRFHMMMGILGPTLIIFHSNFDLNSPNATVAMTAMLVVVASGIIGRYLYARIHMGLYGRKAEAQELLADIAALRSVLGTDISGDQTFMKELRHLEWCLPRPEVGAIVGTWMMLRAGSRTRRAVQHLTRIADDIVKSEAQRQGWSRRVRRQRKRLVREHLSVFQAAVVKTATFALYARLFSLWHHLHLPLFLVLIAAAILHVVAVHLY